jgi:hypothetical protein
VQVAALGLEHAAQLGREREPAGGGEPLGDLLHAELPQGSLVDQLGAGAQGQAQHHVGQVYRLPPGAGAEFDEGDVDQQQAAVADQQVGRLDVAVGQPGLPEPADDLEAVVDDALVDLGLAQLDRAVEELGDQQVLAFGGELDHAVGLRGGEAGVAAHAQGVVLLLDQSPDGVERLFVFQAAVEEFAAELVPAVGAEVVAGVQLAEQVAGRVALDGDP